jgi:hypothetical protein
VKRCYDISPASGQTATVRFYFTEAERNGRSLPNLKVLHYSGTWTPEAGPTAYGGSGDQQYVEAQNISDFSPFALDELLVSTKVFLPLVQRDQTLPPATPVLNPIPTPNATGSYAVSWSTANLAISYTLEEDTANTFPHPTQVYNGPNTAWNASGKTNGTYCYRVRGNNANGSSAWSATQCVTVSIPTGPTPGFWAGPGVELYVTADRQYVHNFAVYISVSGCGNYKITHTSPDAKITNNQFSFSGSFYASGTFTSSTTASGSGGFSHYYIYNCGYITGTFGWSAIWSNSAPPSVTPQEVIRLEGDRPVLRSFEPR